MDPVSSQLLSSDSLRMDSASERFLSLFIEGKYAKGKVAIAKVGANVVMGLGPTSAYHVGIIARAGWEILNERVTTSTDPDRAKENPGVMIEGAFFEFNTHGQIEIFGSSVSFGGFTRSLFDRPTADVVAEFIQSRIVNINYANISSKDIPSLGDQSFDSNHRSEFMNGDSAQ